MQATRKHIPFQAKKKSSTEIEAMSASPFNWDGVQTLKRYGVALDVPLEHRRIEDENWREKIDSLTLNLV